jgi:hypothetical protein
MVFYLWNSPQSNNKLAQLQLQHLTSSTSNPSSFNLVLVVKRVKAKRTKLPYTYDIMSEDCLTWKQAWIKLLEGVKKRGRAIC